VHRIPGRGNHHSRTRNCRNESNRATSRSNRRDPRFKRWHVSRVMALSRRWSHMSQIRSPVTSHTRKVRGKGAGHSRARYIRTGPHPWRGRISVQPSTYLGTAPARCRRTSPWRRLLHNTAIRMMTEPPSSMGVTDRAPMKLVRRRARKNFEPVVGR
jgi:hypothetical protein